MEQPIHTHQTTLFGTLGGTLFCFLVNIHRDDVIKTIVLAALGAVVSFVVSLVLKAVLRRFGK